MARKNWLQKTLGETVEFEPRARQDLDAVISFLSLDQAIQIKPILDFYQQNRVFNLWYPSSYPTNADLQLPQHDWQQTYAFLPPYLTFSTLIMEGTLSQPALTDEEQVSNTLPIESDMVSKSGLFYALGKLVAETVRDPRFNMANQVLTNSPLGMLITDEKGHFRLLPNVFWLDEKQIQPVADYQFYHQP